MSILGVNGALAGAHRNVDKTQKTSTGSGVSFAELAAAGSRSHENKHCYSGKAAGEDG